MERACLKTMNRTRHSTDQIVTRLHASIRENVVRKPSSKAGFGRGFAYCRILLSPRPHVFLTRYGFASEIDTSVPSAEWHWDYNEAVPQGTGGSSRRRSSRSAVALRSGLRPSLRATALNPNPISHSRWYED